MSYYPNDRRQQRRQRRRSIFSGMKLRLMIGAAIVLFSVFRFYSKGQTNPVTGKTQRVDMTIGQEVAMGLQSAPSMGALSRDRQSTLEVERVGAILVSCLEQELYKREPPVRNPYDFNFHLLADRQRINAFALPGGQVFITQSLFDKLQGSEAMLAGVLGHEIGHVIERHGSERMAKGSFIKGLVGAAGVMGGSTSSASAASYVGNMMQMKYGRGDELESDEWGVKLMLIAGYNPEELLGVMDILEKSAGGGGGPEFMSTHPRPANRKEYIKGILSKIPKEILDSSPRRREQRVQQGQQGGGLNFDPNPNLDLDR
jgi:predicted Zn-dependent protease